MLGTWGLELLSVICASAAPPSTYEKNRRRISLINFSFHNKNSHGPSRDSLCCLWRCLSACEKDKFNVVLGHGEEGEEGEVLLKFTINDRFASEEEQGCKHQFTNYIFHESLVRRSTQYTGSSKKSPNWGQGYWAGIELTSFKVYLCTMSGHPVQRLLFDANICKFFWVIGLNIHIVQYSVSDLSKLTSLTEPMRKQYIIYDIDSFIADWGGYMGLILGFREFLDSD